MKRSLNLFVVFLFTFLIFSAKDLQAFSRPTINGAGVLETFDALLLPARLADTFTLTSKPYPTNKWYTSLFVNIAGKTSDATILNAFYGNKISPTPMLVVYDTVFPYTNVAWGNGWGYSLGGHNVGYGTFGPPSGGVGVKAADILPIAVQAAWGSGVDDVIKANSTELKDYGDWSFTAVLTDNVNSTRKMTSTFGKGFLFTYNYFTNNVNPRFRMKTYESGTAYTYYYNNGGVMTQIAPGNQVTTDSIMIKIYTVATTLGASAYQYFAVYAPAGTVFRVETAPSPGEIVNITLSGATESDRYLAIGLLKSPAPAASDVAAFDIFKDYYKYAYNFITDTQVSWAYNSDASITTTYNFTVTPKRTDHAGYVAGQTVYGLYPHHYRNITTGVNTAYTYNTIRGELRVNTGASFQTKVNFQGMLPYFPYEVPDGARKTQLQAYINNDKNFNPSNPRGQNTYYYGKALARAANLIPIFNQTNNAAARNTMITRLKNELIAWYSGAGATDNKFFGYDSLYGGIIGRGPSGYNAIDFIGEEIDFGATKYNDHHFHYGYYIYASALLAMFDPDFASNLQYKEIVDALVKEIANPDRNSTHFPFLRYFDVYEGHSYANGKGGGIRDYGNDEESSSEAMNAWAGIYLWGVATNNEEYKKLGLYLYTTHYEAIRKYYFDIDLDIYRTKYPSYAHSTIGMLFDSMFTWDLWWSPKINKTIMGIQILPVNPTSLYLAYDTTHAQQYYTEMNGETGYDNFWKDVWLKFKSFFDPAGALTDWASAGLPLGFPDTWASNGGGDDGTTLTHSYQFINFFDSVGTLNTGYYATDSSGNSVPFAVTKKGSDYTFVAYNGAASAKIITFYPRGGSPAVPGSGIMNVPARSIMTTKDFASFKTDGSLVFNYNYASPNGWGVSITGMSPALNFDIQAAFSEAPNPASTNTQYEYLGNSYFTVTKTTVSINGTIPMTYDYSSAVIPAGVNEDDLRLAVYDSALQTVTPINIAPNTISHTITVQVGNADFNKSYMLVRVINIDKSVYAYPNPYNHLRHRSAGIHFANLQAGAQISIYNISGEKVFETTTASSGECVWNVRNNSGRTIASGVYIYHIKTGGKTVKGKIAIER
ncbi:glycosyl hydrolase [Endomicrobium proavitum]|uniref:glucan endo-1,3-beta-D-glucosidase n=1 Tax=Endomicrobium proavitum TaxID=1408281 RepID=A0A0G3WM72_9BACT|nr:glycosyl hydrolase [Endomicrobium proavitum]AKL98574.1 putative Endo-1,3(4)-beta-glucanase [Endomicrobium proavitum]